MATKQHQYDKDSIITEDSREFTRRSPSTYLGSSIDNGNLIKEIFANSVDEHAIGHGDKITIKVDTEKNIYVVEDNGQGFLINEPGIDKKTGKKINDGKTILQRSFDTLNTSGKSSANGVYTSALGLNGIGAKLTNWLSKKLVVISYRDGQYEEITFIDGLFKERKVGKTKHPSGTIVTWSPDPQFFTINAPNINLLKDHFELISAFCPTLTIDFTYNGKQIIYNEPEGILAYVGKKVEKKEVFDSRFYMDRTITLSYVVFDDGRKVFDNQFDKTGTYRYVEPSLIGNEKTKEIIYKKADAITRGSQDEKISICITFTSDYSESINAYVNLGRTDSGAHIQAFHTAFVRAVNKYAAENNLLKKNDKNFNINEIANGLYVVFNMTTTSAKYDAQNKSRIDDINTAAITSVIGGDFVTWLNNNPSNAKMIVEKAITERKAREAAQKAKDKIREAGAGKGTKSIFTDLPSKLSDAYPKDKKDRSKCELYICEGDSAASSINAVKNSEFQACFPIRGKILNCLKAKSSEIYSNAEILNIIKAMGLEINPTTHKLVYDERKLRYNKIIIAADEDADGLAIATLIITLFNWLCPEIIEKGHLYHVHGALFKATFNDDTYVLFQTDAELEAWKKKNKKPYTLTRAKGLGELTKDETKEQLVNPATRNLHQLVLDDPDAFNMYLEMFQGEEVAPRLEYLTEHYMDYKE